MARIRYQNWRRFWQSTNRLRTDSRGAVGVEYGLLAALVAIAILGSLKGLGLSLVNLPLPSLVNAFQDALS